MTDRINQKIQRYRQRDSADRPDAAYRQRAQREIDRENVLLWAYDTTTDWGRTRITAAVIDYADERPSPVTIPDIVQAVDDSVLQRRLSFGHSLTGQWFPSGISLGDIPEPQQRLLKRPLAELLVVDHVSEDLFWPESPLGLDDLPAWLGCRVDENPMDVKVERYREFSNIREHNLPAAVRNRLSEDRRSEGDNAT